jgi:hypothetical protein
LIAAGFTRWLSYIGGKGVALPTFYFTNPIPAALIVIPAGWNIRSTRNLNGDIRRMEHQEYPKGEVHNHQ